MTQSSCCLRPNALICMIGLLAQAAVRVSGDPSRADKETIIECTPDRWPDQTCMANNVVLINETIHFITTGGLVIPSVPTNMHRTAPFHKGIINFISPDQLRELLQRGTPDLVTETFPYSILLGEVFERGPFYSNWWHNMMEDGANLHDMMCSRFQLCEYEQEQLSKFLLLLDTPPGIETREEHHWYKGVTCFSNQRPRYVGRIRPLNDTPVTRVTFIDQLSIGRGPLRALLMSYSLTAANRSFPQEKSEYFKTYGSIIASYRARWHTCLGLPPVGTHYDDPATPRPFTVTFVQRRKTRMFLNLMEVMQDLQKEYPDAVFQYLVPERHTLQESAHMFYNTSLLLMSHGASMGNVLFLANHTSIVDILPFSERDEMKESWTGHCVNGFRAAGLHHRSFYYTPDKAAHVMLNLTWLHEQKKWRELNAAEQREILVHNKCPTSHDAFSLCRGRWIFRDALGIIFDPAQFYPFFRALATAARSWIQGVQVPGPPDWEFDYYIKLPQTQQAV